MVEFSGGGVSLTDIGRKTMVFILIWSVISAITSTALIYAGQEPPAVLCTRLEEGLANKLLNALDTGTGIVFWGAFLVGIALTFVSFVKNVLVGIPLLVKNLIMYTQNPILIACAGTIAVFLQTCVILYAYAWLRGYVKE